MIKPTHLNQVAEVLQQASQDKQSLYLQGTATKAALHEKVDAANILSMAGYSGVIDYEPEELVLVVKSGTLLEEVQQLLDEKQQMLAFEPPDLSAILGAEHAGTIGGIVATNLSGSRRLSAGAARDYVLGFDAISGRTDYFKSGSRVMKNVTGYDLSKLMCGSYGTLAVLGEITLKVLPKPQTTKTLQLSVDTLADAQSVLALAFKTAIEPSGAALYRDSNGFQACIRIEGVDVSVADRISHLSEVLKGYSSHQTQHDKAYSEDLWRKITNAEMLMGGSGQLWKLSITPNKLADIISAYEATFKCDFIADWAGGLVWMRCDNTIEGNEIRDVIAQHGGGHGHLIRSADNPKTAVFHPQAEPIAQLQQRIKSAFDPLHLLNSGIMGLSTSS